LQDQNYEKSIPNLMTHFNQNFRFAIMQNMSKDIKCIQKNRINYPIIPESQLKSNSKMALIIFKHQFITNYNLPINTK